MMLLNSLKPSAGFNKRRTVWAVGVLVVALVLLIVAVGQLRWRAQVVLLHMTGQIPDIELKQILVYMLPGSEQSMEFLIERRNPYAVIRNFKTTVADIQAGGQLFRSQCANCHAPDGSGGSGSPALVGRKLKNGESDWAMYRTIQNGVPGTAMKPHSLKDNELWQLVGFIHSLETSADEGERKTVESRDEIHVNVPYEEIASIREPGEDWLAFSGSYLSSRHSVLRQIGPTNVSQLTLRWIHPLQNEPLEVSPVVRKGVMFISAPANAGSNKIQVKALDAATGKQLWLYEYKLAPGTIGGEFGFIVNRGVAILDDKVYLGTPDSRLIALAAATGAPQWTTVVSDDVKRAHISSAPLAYRDLVVTGVATYTGGRGFIAAYDAKTGKERWRFQSIPGPGQPGNETWSGDSWREGGGSTWSTGSYDPESDLLYWTIGNPKPDYDSAVRKGDNLYTDSVVALRGTTGELVWYYQFTPGDDHDWDATQIPIIADHQTSAGIAKRLLQANRNGFYYVLDRVSGKYLNGVPFVRETWTDGIDSKGRPKTAATPNREGTLIYPGNVGGTNWWPPSFDPALNLMFVPVLEQGMVYFSSTSSPPKAQGEGTYFTAIRALDADSGSRVWEFRQDSPPVDNTMGGLLSTDTGILFGGDQNLFFALESRTGKLLWSVETGGMMRAAPITYEVNKEQVVVIASGRNLLAFSLPKNYGNAQAPKREQ